MIEQEIDKAKKKNIIDCALAFTSMNRVFAPGSKEHIAANLDVFSSKLPTVESEKQYTRPHRSFCRTFVGEIATAKTGQAASYGQAAKTLDIVMKVYVYYCGQPTDRVAQRVVSFLHGAVDRQIMKYLKTKYCETDPPIAASTIAGVDFEVYTALQRLIAKDIKERFAGMILPIQYDDIMFRELNR